MKTKRKIYNNALEIVKEVKEELEKYENNNLSLTHNYSRIKNLALTLLRKYSSQKNRYFFSNLPKLYNAYQSYFVKKMSVDYIDYIYRKKPKIPYELFPKKDYEEINYFLRIIVKYALKNFLDKKDYQGRWETYEKMRIYTGKKLKFNFFKNLFELDGFKSVVYPDTGIYPDCYLVDKLRNVKKYRIIFDLGAYIGDTAYFINKILKPEIIFAFEPDPDTFEILKINIKLNNLQRKIIPYPLATSINDGFSYFEQGGIGSKLSNKTLKHTIKVKTVSIDSFIKKENIKKVDLIKMDIEGAEFDTLKGAINTIKNYAPDLLITIYHKGEHFFEIPYFLKNLNANYYLRFLPLNGGSPVTERIILASKSKKILQI